MPISVPLGTGDPLALNHERSCMISSKVGNNLKQLNNEKSSVNVDVPNGSYKDRLTASLWKSYTGYDFDAHTVKIMCKLREVVESDDIVRSMISGDEE